MDWMLPFFTGGVIGLLVGGLAGVCAMALAWAARDDDTPDMLGDKLKERSSS